MKTRVFLNLAMALAFVAIQSAAAARVRGLPPSSIRPPSNAPAGAGTQPTPTPTPQPSTATPTDLPELTPITLSSGAEVDANTVVLRFKTSAAAAEVEAKEKVYRRGDRGRRGGGIDAGVVRKRDNESIEEAVTRLNALSVDVDVEPNYIYRPLAVPNDVMYAAQQAPAMNKVAVPAAWDVSTGSGANNNGLACVIDTGIDYRHPDLAPAYAGGFNAMTNTTDPMDDMGHGTHCAGTIAASGNNGVGIAGINWSGRVLGCKFMGPNGGSTADAITCVNWCVAQGAKVLSASWGGGGFSQALLDAINAANNASALFIAAAGNSGRNNDVTPVYPASYKAANMITVATSTLTDTRPTYSNYGPKTVHIAAPGDNIMSTFPNNTYVLMGGTSMAAPFVSGAAALIYSATNGKLTAAQVRAAILNNADKFATITSIEGNRRLNVAKALNAAITAANGGVAMQTTPPPTPARMPPPSGGITAQTATNPNPSNFPPPPATGTFPITPITRGTSISANLANGGTFQLPSAFLTAPSCTNYRTRLTGTTAASYKKHVYEIGLGGSTAAFTATMCGSKPTTGWDAVATVLTCNSALTSCSACAAETSSCGLMGAVLQRSVSTTSRYLVVVTSSAAGAGGAYNLKV